MVRLSNCFKYAQQRLHSNRTFSRRSNYRYSRCSWSCPYSGYTAGAKEQVCLGHYAQLKKKINQNWLMCDINGEVPLKGQFTNGVEGTERNVACTNFGTIAGETVKDFTNYAKSPYEKI